MGRPKLVKSIEIEVHTPEVKHIHPLTQEFGNGDLNILKDKINEIIKVIK